LKLLIFGPTGGTGRLLVEQALQKGYPVTAFARDPAKMAPERTGLHVVEGDALDAAAVERAVPGHTAVLCAVGAPASDRRTVRTEATRNIIRAMEIHEVERLVCLSSLGFGDTRDMLPFVMRYIVVPLFLRHAFADHALQEKLIKQSDLEWIIARASALTDGPWTGVYRHGFFGTEKGTRLKISRADVADFMLNQLTSDGYLHQTPGLSY
jgi:putative NADH-flavin reductase